MTTVNLPSTNILPSTTSQGKSKQAAIKSTVEERAALAKTRIESIFNDRKLLFFKHQGLLRDHNDSWVDVGRYTLILPPAESADEAEVEKNKVQIYVDTQENIVRTETFPEGMFLIRLGGIPRLFSQTTQLYATYIANEDKFYFKYISLLRSYASKASERKRSSFKRSAVLLKPKEESNSDMLDRFYLDDEGAPLTIGGYKGVCTTSTLYFTESDFIEILDKASEHISNYPADMKLTFKIMAKTLIRSRDGYSKL